MAGAGSRESRRETETMTTEPTVIDDVQKAQSLRPHRPPKAEKPKRPARPRKGETCAKTTSTVALRLTVEERDTLRAKADAAGLSVSRYVAALVASQETAEAEAPTQRQQEQDKGKLEIQEWEKKVSTIESRLREAREAYISAPTPDIRDDVDEDIFRLDIAKKQLQQLRLQDDPEAEMEDWPFQVHLDLDTKVRWWLEKQGITDPDLVRAKAKVKVTLGEKGWWAYEGSYFGPQWKPWEGKWVVGTIVVLGIRPDGRGKEERMLVGQVVMDDPEENRGRVAWDTSIPEAPTVASSADVDVWIQMVLARGVTEADPEAEAAKQEAQREQ